LFFCAATAAQAGSSLTVRLVEASNSGTGASAGLNDVVPVLKRSLAFSSYRLVASAGFRLPAVLQTRDVGGYSVTCMGSQERLEITVTRGGQVMLNTQVALRDGIPLILGGFPAGNGRHVLVFAAR
jgi:hypothetical protein